MCRHLSRCISIAEFATNQTLTQLPQLMLSAIPDKPHAVAAGKSLFSGEIRLVKDTDPPPANVTWAKQSWKIRKKRTGRDPRPDGCLHQPGATSRIGTFAGFLAKKASERRGYCHGLDHGYDLNAALPSEFFSGPGGCKNSDSKSQAHATILQLRL